jgi:drug/metabolite transporter, DME family
MSKLVHNTAQRRGPSIRNSKTAPLMVLAGAFFWGTTGTAQALAPSGAHPVLVGAVRISVAALALLVMALIRKSLGKQAGASLFGESPAFTNPWLLFASLGLAAYQPLFFSAVSLTGVAVGTVVTLGSAPICSGILDWYLGRGKPGMVWLVATALAIGGCAVLVFGKGDVTISPVGILLAVGAGFSFALYVGASKQLLVKHASGAVILPAFIIATLMLSPSWFLFSKAWLFTPRGLAVSLHLGIVATALAYILFTRGLQGVRAPTAVTLSMAEPVTASLLGVFFLGEVLSVSALAGILIVFSGLAIVSIGSLRVRSQA